MQGQVSSFGMDITWRTTCRTAVADARLGAVALTRQEPQDRSPILSASPRAGYPNEALVKVGWVLAELIMGTSAPQSNDCWTSWHRLNPEGGNQSVWNLSPRRRSHPDPLSRSCSLNYTQMQGWQGWSEEVWVRASAGMARSCLNKP